MLSAAIMAKCMLSAVNAKLFLGGGGRLREKYVTSSRIAYAVSGN